MRPRILVAMCFALLAAALATAQGFSGKWAGEMQGPGPLTSVLLDLRVDGTKVTGMYKQGKNLPTIDIIDGKIEGGKLTFKTIQDLNGLEVRTTWVGELKGDELQMNRPEVLGRGKPYRGKLEPRVLLKRQK
jgi:hypothetical protein